ncbi:hypothetical protein [Phenylobacterium sp. J367]|nr:hypothetical protein [Phenylobacterium sp. J367]MCR5878524.1 hypothetical protein [Phenylobacterium sp. J367]
MKNRTPRTFQVVYRRRKVLNRPDIRPQHLAVAPPETRGRLMLGGRS